MRVNGRENGITGQSSGNVPRNDSPRSNGTGLFVRRDDVWVVDTNSKNPFNNDKYSKISYRELPQDETSAQAFVDAITEAKKNLGARDECVDAHDTKKYAECKTFLSEDGLSGVAVTKDGEIISVFCDPGSKFIDARQCGRLHRFCSDTLLWRRCNRCGLKGDKSS